MNTVNNSTNTEIRWIEVKQSEAGQRLDNFLLKRLKGVPKSRIYRLLRKGELRVNKKRKKPDYRIEAGDQVRIPPIRTSSDGDFNVPQRFLDLLKSSIIYEDDWLVVLNKPSGMAVHSGSGLPWGVIEAYRQTFPDQQSIELVHRIDRATSGCLLLAKTRESLLAIQEQIKNCSLKKTYLALTRGCWNNSTVKVDAPLQKNVMQGGERMVQVSEQGKPAISYFRTLQSFENCSLCEVDIVTGRTHQIRVHAASQGHPLAGDQKYGDDEFNKQMKGQGLKRLFLHAASVTLAHPYTHESLTVEAPLSEELQEILTHLQKEGSDK